MASSDLIKLINANSSWNGSSHISESVSLDFSISLSITDNMVQGSISIPAQNAFDLPLDEIELRNDVLSFTLKPPKAPKIMWAKYEFSNATGSTSLEGTLKQMGKTFPTTLKSGAPPKASRPQTPKPPFNYTTKEVSYQTSDNAIIAGTLTIPQGEGPHPAQGRGHRLRP